MSPNRAGSGPHPARATLNLSCASLSEASCRLATRSWRRVSRCAGTYRQSLAATQEDPHSSSAPENARARRRHRCPQAPLTSHVYRPPWNRP